MRIVYIDDSTTGHLQFNKFITEEGKEHLIDRDLSIKVLQNGRNFFSIVGKFEDYHIDKDLLLILDLKLTRNTKIINQILKENPELKLISNVDSVSGTYIGLTAIRKKELRYLLICLASSSDASMNELVLNNAFNALNEDMQSGRRFKIIRIPTIAEHYEYIAKPSLQSAIKEWDNFRTTYHSDFAIDEALKMYSKPWEEKWTAKKWYWEHNDINNNNNEYRKLFSDWLGTTIEDENQIKPICMWEANWNGEDNKPGWYNWKNKDFFSNRPINEDTLRAIFNKLDLTIEIKLMEPNEVFLPVIPALPFLLSLKYFVSKVIEENSDINILFSDFMGNYGRLYAISIIFNKTRGKEGYNWLPVNECIDDGYYWPEKDLSKTYFGKIIGNQLSGISEYLSDLIWGRLTDIRKDIDDKSNPWITIFKGVPPCKIGGPVVNPIFAPHALHLCWAGKKA